MADYELSEETFESIALEDSSGYILLEGSVGPEGWEYVGRTSVTWVHVPRSTR